MSDYTYCLRFGTGCDEGGNWLLIKGGVIDGEVVFSMCAHGSHEMPAEFKAKYEELLGRPEFLPEKDAPIPEAGIVELISADEDCAFDQPCAHGHRVEGHAVYCHNTAWLYAPRKCRRTWYTGGEVRDEDCPGFKPNPANKRKSEDLNS